MNLSSKPLRTLAVQVIFLTIRHDLIVSIFCLNWLRVSRFTKLVLINVDLVCFMNWRLLRSAVRYQFILEIRPLWALISILNLATVSKIVVVQILVLNTTIDFLDHSSIWRWTLHDSSRRIGNVAQIRLRFRMWDIGSISNLLAL